MGTPSAVAPSVTSSIHVGIDFFVLAASSSAFLLACVVGGWVSKEVSE